MKPGGRPFGPQEVGPALSSFGLCWCKETLFSGSQGAYINTVTSGQRTHLAGRHSSDVTMAATVLGVSHLPSLALTRPRLLHPGSRGSGNGDKGACRPRGTRGGPGGPPKPTQPCAGRSSGLTPPGSRPGPGVTPPTTRRATAQPLPPLVRGARPRAGHSQDLVFYWFAEELGGETRRLG